ncbi:hypothetical protein ABFA07_001429 [Porites harrisoni]
MFAAHLLSLETRRRDSASTVCKKGEREASSTNQFLPQNEATLKTHRQTQVCQQPFTGLYFKTMLLQ